MYVDHELFRSQNWDVGTLPRERLEQYFYLYTGLLQCMLDISASVDIQKVLLNEAVKNLAFTHAEQTGEMVPGQTPAPDQAQEQSAVDSLLNAHTVILNTLRGIEKELYACGTLMAASFKCADKLAINVPIDIHQMYKDEKLREAAKDRGLTVARGKQQEGKA